MEQKELKEKILQILDKASENMHTTTICAQIMQLIHPQGDSTLEEASWEIVEWKSSRGIWYRCAHLDDSKNHPQYALEKMESIRNTGPHMAEYPEEFQINAIKVKERVYRVNDKIVWDWVSYEKKPSYATIKQFTIKSNKLYVEVNEFNQNGPYDMEVLIKWHLRYYQPTPEPIQEKVDVNGKRLVNQVKVAMQTWLSGLHPANYAKFEDELLKIIKNQGVPVEKEPEIVLTVEQRVERIEQQLKERWYK